MARRNLTFVWRGSRSGRGDRGTWGFDRPRVWESQTRAGSDCAPLIGRKPAREKNGAPSRPSDLRSLCLLDSCGVVTSLACSKWRSCHHHPRRDGWQRHRRFTAALCVGGGLGATRTSPNCRDQVPVRLRCPAKRIAPLPRQRGMAVGVATPRLGRCQHHERRARMPDTSSHRILGPSEPKPTTARQSDGATTTPSRSLTDPNQSI